MTLFLSFNVNLLYSKHSKRISIKRLDYDVSFELTYLNFSCYDQNHERLYARLYSKYEKKASERLKARLYSKYERKKKAND
jgi:hypothetical protein